MLHIHFSVEVVIVAVVSVILSYQTTRDVCGFFLLIFEPCLHILMMLLLSSLMDWTRRHILDFDCQVLLSEQMLCYNQLIFHCLAPWYIGLLCHSLHFLSVDLTKRFQYLLQVVYWHPVIQRGHYLLLPITQWCMARTIVQNLLYKWVLVFFGFSCYPKKTTLAKG